MDRDERDGVKPTDCPRCGHHLDAATSPGDDTVRPVPGDLTVCIKCATVMVFDAEGEPVLATEAELARLDIDTRHRVDRIRRAILMVQERGASS